MRLSVGQKLVISLITFLVALLGSAVGFSHLLHVSTTITTELAQAARNNAQVNLELIASLARTQGVVLKLVRTEDPDAIESLMATREQTNTEVRQRLAAVTQGGEELLKDLGMLDAANNQVVNAVLRGRGAQANQIFIDSSNPAFEEMLLGIKQYQDQAMRRIDQQAASGNADLKMLRLVVWAMGVLISITLTVGGLLLIRSISGTVQGLGEQVQDMAQGQGDLTRRLPVLSRDDLGELARGMNSFLDKLQVAVKQVADSTNQIATATEQISVMARSQANSADAQRDQTHQVAVAMQQMGATTQEVSHNSTQAAEASTQAAVTAAKGGEIVNQTLDRMHTISGAVAQAAERIQSLGASSVRVGEIVDVIGNIASQTNLLALNAAIEAARAGEQGRGFAVVADEVRILAARTTQATREIGEVIANIQQEIESAVQAMRMGTGLVAQGVDTTSQAGTALQQIIQTSTRVGEMITQIATAATEQAAATEEVNHSLGRISQDTSISAVAAEQASRAAQDLLASVHILQQVVRQFKL